MMMQPWHEMNETDVREEIIAPFLRNLGYASGTENDIQREKKLEYPHDFIGRKKPGRDKKLAGEADYILTVQAGDAHLRWVIEAKPPHEELGWDAVDQAYSYARHPEVGSVLYTLCNGREFVVYRTATAPRETPPIYRGVWPQWVGDPALRDILAPDALRLHFRDITELAGQPLGFGLGPVERVRSGSVRYHTVPEAITALKHWSLNIPRGTLDRSANGLLRLHIWVDHPDHEAHTRMTSFVKNDIFLLSPDTRLSDDLEHPTRFIGWREIIMPAGKTIGDRIIGAYQTLSEDLHATSEARMIGVLKDGVFAGQLGVQTVIEARGVDMLAAASFEIMLR